MNGGQTMECASMRFPNSFAGLKTCDTLKPNRKQMPFYSMNSVLFAAKYSSFDKFLVFRYNRSAEKWKLKESGTNSKLWKNIAFLAHSCAAFFALLNSESFLQI